MRCKVALVTMALCAAVLSPAVVAPSDGRGGGGSAGGSAGKPGGKLTMLATDDVDWIDPGRTHSSFGFAVAYATQKPLYSYRPDDTESPVADLADGPPEITDDGSTVTVRIKQGIRFSPPVGREVTAADVKYAIERGFFGSVANGYAGAYFGSVQGARTGAKAGTRIDGIATPGRYVVRFSLSRPAGAVLAAALALPLSAPVPEEYAAAHDAEPSSTYGAHQVATGPYMVENDRDGRATGHRPGELIRLVRNPSWDGARDHRPAALDEIEIREGRTDTAAASREILRGASMINGDFSPDPQIIRQAVGSGSTQVVLVPSRGGRHVSLNTTMEPFDDVDVRRAVVAGFDREAMRRARGGALMGDVPTHIIPPGVPGHAEAGGALGPGLDFLASPRGDRRLAEEYFRRAGFASGRYESSGPLLMVAAAGGVAQEEAEVARKNFERLGFDIRLKLVADDVVRARLCGVPARTVAICPGMAWSADFPDGEGILRTRFDGSSVGLRTTPNWSLLDDPRINTDMDRAAGLREPSDRSRAWGEVDVLVTSRAPVIPWLWDRNAQIRSQNVSGVVDRFTARWSLTYSALD